RETVVDGVTGARVAPGDPAALAGAIRAMISIGADARDNMGEAGAKYARPRFSKLALQIATLGVYKDVLDNQDTKDIDGR
ncbi:MAG: glycosyl transferase, partial [Hyphomonadaceae bacterium]